jgi:hypothetical protein
MAASSPADYSGSTVHRSASRSASPPSLIPGAMAGRACQRRSPQGPKDEKPQCQTQSLRQEMVRQPPIRLMVHSYQ